MTDTEMLTLCAEAMGYDISAKAGVVMCALTVEEMKRQAAPFPIERNAYSWFRYDPLLDDVQAMALVKRFELQIEPPWLHAGRGWLCAYATEECADSVLAETLNHAIVECVAMLAARQKGGT